VTGRALLTPTERLFRRTEEELLGARADPLVRIAEKLEKQLAELDRLRRESRAASGPDRGRLSDRHREILRRARRQHWYLVVQREAVGLRDHSVLSALYPLPDPLAG
jgi:hypothetical protein